MVLYLGFLHGWLGATGVTPATPPALAAAARAPKRVERLAADGAALRAALLDWG